MHLTTLRSAAWCESEEFFSRKISVSSGRIRRTNDLRSRVQRRFPIKHCNNVGRGTAGHGHTRLHGGAGNVRLEEENNISSGLIIEASPAGKKVLNLDAMSGGEKTLTSLAFLFAVMQHYQVPFYVLDEVDAALDKSNTKKIIELIKKYSNDIQFIVVTHNDFTIQEADKVFGVSMESGVSKIFGIEMPAV